MSYQLLDRMSVRLGGTEINKHVKKVEIKHEVGCLPMAVITVFASDLELNGRPAVPPPLVDLVKRGR